MQFSKQGAATPGLNIRANSSSFNHTTTQGFIRIDASASQASSSQYISLPRPWAGERNSQMDHQSTQAQTAQFQTPMQRWEKENTQQAPWNKIEACAAPSNTSDMNNGGLETKQE